MVMSTTPVHAPCRRCLRLALALALLDALAVFLYLAWGRATLPPPIPERPHATGVVFFDDFARDGSLGAESRRRIAHALELARLGLVRELICVGGRRRDRARSGAELMAAALIAGGLTADHVRGDHRSFDTRSNWRSARALLADSGAGAADPLLISSPLHLLRIRHVTGGAGTPAPTMTIVAALHRAPMTLWLDVHREWIAWAAMALLPPHLHQRWIRAWRDFWDHAPGTTRLPGPVPAAQS